MEDMRNIVVLKDLPSNLVEEAIIVLKQNQKIKKPEYVENKGKAEQKSEKHKFGNYITKEAEMLITDYITKVEKNKKNKEIKKIENIAKADKVVGIGEIGLDYYWNKENKELQQMAFINQIKLANKLNLPIIIHTREAVMDTIKILKENTPNKKGVFHCCPLNKELVKEGLNLGFYISLAGPITFKNSKNADEIIQMIPLEKMLIETDSPYLAPEPNRGTRNDSRNLKYLVEKIAQVKQIEPEEIAEITYNNWKF